MRRILAASVLIISACASVWAQRPEFYYEMSDSSIFDGVSCTIDESSANGITVWDVTMVNS